MDKQGVQSSAQSESTEQNFKKAREEKLQKIKELGWNPYAASYEKKHMISEARESEGKTVKTAGRLYSLREHGNIAFADLKDETGRIQIFFQKKLLKQLILTRKNLIFF